MAPQPANDSRTEPTRVELVEVEPHKEGRALVTLDDSVRLIVDSASVDGSDNLTFWLDNRSTAHAKALGVPLEVPNLIRRAIAYGEPGAWGR